MPKEKLTPGQNDLLMSDFNVLDSNIDVIIEYFERTNNHKTGVEVLRLMQDLNREDFPNKKEAWGLVVDKMSDHTEVKEYLYRLYLDAKDPSSLDRNDFYPTLETHGEITDGRKESIRGILVERLGLRVKELETKNPSAKPILKGRKSACPETCVMM